MKKIIITFIILISFLISVSVSAQEITLLPACATGPGNCTACDIAQLFVNWATSLAGFVGALALLFFVLGGMYWVLSAGNEERITKGKKMMIGSLIGVTIVFTAWVIVGLVVHTLMGKEKFGGVEGDQLFTAKQPQNWWKIECLKTVADCTGATIGTPCEKTTEPSGTVNTLCWWTNKAKTSPDQICGKKVKDEKGKEYTADCQCYDYCQYYAETIQAYDGYSCILKTEVAETGSYFSLYNYDYITTDVCARQEGAQQKYVCAKAK